MKKCEKSFLPKNARQFFLYVVVYVTGPFLLTKSIPYFAKVFLLFFAVLRIRIRIRIHMFLGLLDPDPDPLVRGMDPDPTPAQDPHLDPSITKQK